MTKLAQHLLARSAEETSRRLCLGLLDDASSALQRMDDPNDDEAMVAYLYRRSVREEAIWRGALGVGETAKLQPLRF